MLLLIFFYIFRLHINCRFPLTNHVPILAANKDLPLLYILNRMRTVRHEQNTIGCILQNKKIDLGACEFSWHECAVVTSFAGSGWMSEPIRLKTTTKNKSIVYSSCYCNCPFILWIMVTFYVMKLSGNKDPRSWNRMLIVMKVGSVSHRLHIRSKWAVNKSKCNLVKSNWLALYI